MIHTNINVFVCILTFLIELQWKKCSILIKGNISMSSGGIMEDNCCNVKNSNIVIDAVFRLKVMYTKNQVEYLGII